MKRRTMIALAGAGAVFALGAWRLTAATQRDAILAVLRKRLDYLRLDPVGVGRFADDLVATKEISRLRLRLIGAAGPLYEDLPLSGGGRIRHTIRHGEERIVTLYLLSSDFFRHGADESRVIQYVGMYDPLQACANPFARPMGMPASA